MSTATPRDIKTLAYVLRRTNYGEADRILNIITPSGKKSVIAKSVRKEKSKLAGGVEMFSLVELNIHQGRGEMGLVTSARMIKYHSNLVTDFSRMELAAEMLKKVSFAAEGTETGDFFEIVRQGLTELDSGADARVVKTWFIVKLLKASGEELNLYRDSSGEKLMAGALYNWDAMEKAFIARDNGEFNENDIKLLRLMTTSDLVLVRRVKNIGDNIDKILSFARNMV
ncbi:DNA repair protein RecO [Candidatus Saccharibacteria bacterium]|nr:DNA repair protein RecO [Candidatus Saccharibacteria bacterium]